MTIGIARGESAEQRREIGADRAVGPREVHRRSGELVVGDQKVARVHEHRPLGLARGGRQQSARTDARRSSRPCRARAAGSAGAGGCPAACCAARSSSASTCARLRSRRRGAIRRATAARCRRAICSTALRNAIGALGKPRALEQLIGDARKADTTAMTGSRRRASARIRPTSRTVAGVASDDPPNLRTLTRRSLKLFHRHCGRERLQCFPAAFTLTAICALDQQHWKPPPPWPVESLLSRRRM